jgi:hypothetical protein
MCCGTFNPMGKSRLSVCCSEREGFKWGIHLNCQGYKQNILLGGDYNNLGRRYWLTESKRYK